MMNERKKSVDFLGGLALKTCDSKHNRFYNDRIWYGEHVIS